MTELLIAWRYIRSKRKERVVSAIAAFSFVGIALGVATLIIVTSVMNGFRKEFTDRVIGFNGHFTAYPTEMINTPKVIQSILSVKDVVYAMPMVEKQALISNSKTVSGTLCNGVLCDDIKKKEMISKNIVAGSIDDFQSENAIMVGDFLAKKAHLKIGGDVIMIVPEMDSTGFGSMPRKKTFKLAAIFKSGMYEYDSSVSFINISMAQKLFKMKSDISCISIFIQNPLVLAEIESKLHESIGGTCEISNWQRNNSSFMNAVEVERNVMFIILTLIIIVASFNIIACMIMLVKDKEKEIAILKTIGFSKNSIMQVFFIVGSSIGVIGTMLGSLVGVLFAFNIQKIQGVVERVLGASVFSPEVYFLTSLPSILRPMDVVVTVFVSIILSCIATLYPSRRASKLNPTEILRYA